jgi:bisphosphoglycerate-independent phosphoglycerate mutase (AlkP superfamily)
MLWIRHPGGEHSEHAGKVPLNAVAPTILSMFGVDPPASMRGQPIAAREPAAA